MALTTARDAQRLLSPLLSQAEEERLAVVHLDGTGSPIAIDELEGGSHPLRAIVRAALERESRALVIGHSHPSGDATPSAEDIDATRQLALVAARLGIRLHDHLIFAGSACSSFRALGLL